MVSLASEAIFSSQEEGVRSTINLLEEAGVHWVGLSVKRDDLVPVNGLRVGFLGFCAVYKECETREGVPYAPVRYSSKTASTAVRSLKSVSDPLSLSLCVCVCVCVCLCVCVCVRVCELFHL